MASLKNCPACKGNVSTNAKVCPHCGHRFLLTLLGLFGYVGGGIAVLYLMGKWIAWLSSR